jgi:hypothetical protein
LGLEPCVSCGDGLSPRVGNGRRIAVDEMGLMITSLEIAKVIVNITLPRVHKLKANMNPFAVGYFIVCKLRRLAISISPSTVACKHDHGV